MSCILSKSECEKIVQCYLNHNNFEVVNFKCGPFSKNINGFLGGHLLIHVKVKFIGNEDIHKLTFFAKRLPNHQHLSEVYCSSIKGFETEICLYDVVLEEFKKTIPGYEADYVPKYCFGKNKDFMVFEDLSLKEYTTAKMHNLNLLDFDHLRLALKSLAKFHCGTIVYEEIKSTGLANRFRIIDRLPIPIDEPIFVNDEKHIGNKYLEASLKVLICLIDELPMKGIPADEFKQKLKLLHKTSFNIMKPQNKFRNVLCHGNLLPKNLMFKYEDEVPVDCMLVDFQLQRYIPPAHDVLTLIYMTTNKEMRQHEFHNLLRYYHNCLKEELCKSEINIKTVLPFDEFKVSVQFYLPQVKLSSAYQFSMFSTNAELMNDLYHKPEEYQRFVFDDRSLYIKQVFYNDANFYLLLSEALFELKEIVSIQKVSLEDCYSVMNIKLGSSYYEFDSFSLVPYPGASGAMGDYYKLTININYHRKKQQYTFFVKCMPTEKSSNKMATATGLFSKETFVYETFAQMAKNLGLHIIKDCIINCYFTRTDDLAILDDMSVEGYKNLSTKWPLAFEIISLGINKLAKFHAVSLMLEDKMTKQFDEPYRLNKYFDKYVKEIAFRKEAQNLSEQFWTVGANSIDIVIDLFPEIIDSLSVEDFKLKANKVRELFYENIKPSDVFRNVLCHGDLWATNLLFKYSNNEVVDCKIIDFQYTRYCVPGHDVLSFIYFTSNRELRAEKLDELISIYYKALSDAIASCGGTIEEIYPYNTFLEMLQFIKPQAIVHNIIMQEFIGCSSDQIDAFLGDEEVSAKTCFEDRSELIHSMCRISQDYKDILKETILDLYDYCKTLE